MPTNSSPQSPFAMEKGVRTQIKALLAVRPKEFHYQTDAIYTVLKHFEQHQFSEKEQQVIQELLDIWESDTIADN